LSKFSDKTLLFNGIIQLLTVLISFLIFKFSKSADRGLIAVTFIYPQLINGLVNSSLERLCFVNKKITNLLTDIYFLMIMFFSVFVITYIFKSELIFQQSYLYLVIGLIPQYFFSKKIIIAYLNLNENAINNSRLAYQISLFLSVAIHILINKFTPNTFVLCHVFSNIIALFFLANVKLYRDSSLNIDFSALFERNFIFGILVSNLSYLPLIFIYSVMDNKAIGIFTLISSLSRLSNFFISTKIQKNILNEISGKTFSRKSLILHSFVTLFLNSFFIFLYINFGHIFFNSSYIIGVSLVILIGLINWLQISSEYIIQSLKTRCISSMSLRWFYFYSLAISLNYLLNSKALFVILFGLLLAETLRLAFLFKEIK
jgi:hypothetical protein